MIKDNLNKMRELIKNGYFKFGFWTFIFLLFVIWIKSFWLLIFIPVIFDFYVSNKVNWTFWKKRDAKTKTKMVEWIDAVVFAVIAASIIRMFFIEAYMIPTSSMEKTLLVGDYLFVSKASYGPRMPNTPLSVPFTHHTMPLTKDTKPYFEWIKSPYKRLAGLTEIKRNDIVVFNFPEGDTVVVERQETSYYSIIRQNAEQLKSSDILSGNKVLTDEEYYKMSRLMVRENFTIVDRPVDKRENYIKRCVAIPGDVIKIVHGDVFVNDKPQEKFQQMQYKYRIKTDGTLLNLNRFNTIGVSNEDLENSRIGTDEYLMPLTIENLNRIKNYKGISSITKYQNPEAAVSYIFPFDSRYKWNEDNFGPLTVPTAGKTIKIDTSNISIYYRIIETYEGNKLKISNGKILINDKVADKYTFKMNYYFMMGDSRHNSADSRFWGFVPEDHVVGKALFVWMSTDKDKSFFRGRIRFDRIFKIIHD
jgi:signal peptidase I